MENLQYWISRFLLLIIYLSYFIVAFAVNIDSLEDKFNLSKLLKQDTINLTSSVYSGAFQNEKNMLVLVKKYNIKRVISLMDPRLPAYNELHEYEKNLCKKHNIEFINIPLANLDKRKSKIDMIIYVINSKKVPTYIHGYLDDRGSGNIIKSRLYDGKQTH